MMVRDIASWLSINCNCKRSRLRHSCSITSTMIPVFLLSSMKNQKYDSNKIYKPHVLFKHYPSDGVILKKIFYIEQFTFREFCIYWLYVWNHNDVIYSDTVKGEASCIVYSKFGSVSFFFMFYVHVEQWYHFICCEWFW